MKVLVTGGAGYIGSHATASLIESGYQVVILDNLSRGFKNLIHPKANFVEGDVRDTELVARVIREYQVRGIIHFAAFIKVDESLQLPDLYYDNNFGGTLSVLSACVKEKVPHFVFSSTAAVYKDPGKELVTEQSATGPVTPYGASKLMSEEAIQDISVSSGLRYMVLRYFNVAGASASLERGQYGKNASALIKRVAQVASGQIPFLSIFGNDYPTKDGTAVRDFIHVEDLADLHVEALKALEKGASSEIVNCGYGHGFSVRDVIQTMKKLSGNDFQIREEARRPGDLAQVVASNEKIKKLFKWQPRRDNLELICRSAYEWELKTLRDAK